MYIFFLKENLFIEKFKNIKNLFDELENSIKISNSLDNNLMLHYVLSQIEKESLSHKISEKNKNLTSESLFCPRVNHLFSKYFFQFLICIFYILDVNHVYSSITDSPNSLFLVDNKESKYVSCSDLAQEEKLNHLEEVQKLYRNINELEEQVKSRENTIGILCHKYLYLKKNKDKMVNCFFFPPFADMKIFF